jgi:sulfur-oxidizing protein SoxZ
MDKPRIKLPDTAKAGDIIDVRAVVTDPMETGNRKDANGQTIPRKIINSFVATFAGKEVFRAEFGPGISANPFILFSMRVPGPGTFEFTWVDDDNLRLSESVTLNVVA